MYLWLHTRALYSIEPSLGCINYNLLLNSDNDVESRYLLQSSLGLLLVSDNLATTSFSPISRVKGTLSETQHRDFRKEVHKVSR